MDTNKIIDKVKNLTLTKELYRYKKKGLIPTIRVRQNTDGTLIQAVTMKVGPVTYYFHNTDKAKVETYEEDGIKWTTFPFDGWDVSNPEAEDNSN